MAASSRPRSSFVVLCQGRRLLKDCGDLDWGAINPDIFGSMIQSIVDKKLRGDLGMHYTSVPNIMKALRPLFLDSLEVDFARAWDDLGKLERLLVRIRAIRVFDPACGSGNFLIIAYKELRKLETRIFERMMALSKQFALPMSEVNLNHSVASNMPTSLPRRRNCRYGSPSTRWTSISRRCSPEPPFPLCR